MKRLALILTGYLLVLLDVSILMAALPRIHADLGFSATSLSWAQNAYTLTFGGLLLLGARIGDLAGRRRIFMVGIGLFTVASLAVGLAQSPAWMISARAAQGIGAALLAPSTLALLSTSFPEGPQRMRAMAAYGALAGIGTAVGLILGGALTETLSWRYGFFLNVPVGVAAIIAAPRLIEETERHHGRVDIAGALCSTLGVSALVFGIVRSADAGWADAATIGAVVAGSSLIALFVCNQRRAPQPLLPLRLFASRRRSGAYAARFLFNGVLVSFFFFMTQYLQGVRRLSPLEAGLAFLPVTAAAFAAAAVTPRLTRRHSSARLAIVGCVAMLIGTAWIGRGDAIALPMIVFGIGQGLGLSTLTTAGMAGVVPQDAGIAGGLVNVSHHLGGALGLGVLVTVFDAAGPGLADQVSAALTAACAFLALAIAILVVTARRTPCRSPETRSTPTSAPPTGSRVRSSSTPSPQPHLPLASPPPWSTSPPAPAPPGTPIPSARPST